MCHAARISLSEPERAEVKKWYGILLPVYASIALCVLAGVTLSVAYKPGPGKALVATADNAAQSTDIAANAR
jgi:hypothetical protein